MAGMDGAGIRQAMTKAFSGLWREGFSNSRLQECWLEAQSRVQLDRAGYQGFQLNSSEKRLSSGNGFQKTSAGASCIPAKAWPQTDQV